MHGIIESVSNKGINISLRGVYEGKSCNMPPALDAILPAKPGSYHLYSTDETIDNPDFVSTWDVTEPSPENEKE